MAQTSNNLPQAASNVAFGGVAWSNPNNAKLVGSGVATASFASPDTSSDYLLASNYILNIPFGSTISGVVVTVLGYSDYVLGGVNQPQTLSARLYFGGVIGTAKTALQISSDTSGAAQTVGSDTDVWGASLSAGLCNNTGFGVVFYFGVAGADSFPVTASIDYVKVQVYYVDNLGRIKRSLLGVG